MSMSLNKWSFVAVLVAAILARMLHALVGRFFRRRKYRLPPGPAGLPLLGRLGVETHRTLWDHRKKYGDVSYINVCGMDIVVLNSAEVIRDAFTGSRTAEAFGARPVSLAQQVVPEDIILRSMTADHWKQSRMMFHSLLKQYGEGIAEIERVVSSELTVVVESLIKKDGDFVDMDEYFQPSLVNILLILLIGERIQYADSRIKICAELVRLQSSIFQPLRDLVLRKIPFLRYLPFGLGALYKRACRHQEMFFEFIFRRYKDLSVESLESRKGIVFELLKLRRKNDWLTDNKIEGIVMDTFAAGFNTTDSSLRSLFLILLHFPGVQTEIRAEIDDVIGSARRPTVSDRDRMAYTVAAILELSRYSSVAALAVAHSCEVDTEFRGFTVPSGCVLVPNMVLVNHDDSVWDNPSKFDPRRFLDASGGVLPADHPTRKNLIPFGVGKRSCLGEKFAKTRIFLYVTYLLQVFTFEPDDNLPSCHPLSYEPDSVLIPPEYKVKIARRK